MAPLGSARIDADQESSWNCHERRRLHQDRAQRSRRNNAETGPPARNGARVPSGCPSRSAMTHSAAGLKPSPTWAPRTSTFSLWGPYRLLAPAKRPRRRSGCRSKWTEPAAARRAPAIATESGPGRPRRSGGADVRGRRRGEGTAQRDDHSHRVGVHPRRFAGDDAAAAPEREAAPSAERCRRRGPPWSYGLDRGGAGFAALPAPVRAGRARFASPDAGSEAPGFAAARLRGVVAFAFAARVFAGAAG